MKMLTPVAVIAKNIKTAPNFIQNEQFSQK